MSWLLACASVLAVSLVALLGLVALSWDQARVRRLSLVFVSFAVGALLGDTFIHLLPEIFADGEGTLDRSLAVLGGVLLFFVLEKLLRHAHGPLYAQHHERHRDLPALRAVNVVGDALHNFIDGALIGASYLVSPELGLTTTVAVFFHEVPQEVGDFGVLVHSGLSTRRALLVNLGSASTAIAGTLLVLVVGATSGQVIARALIPVAAGGFVYIAAADLIPELQHDRSLRALLVQTVLIAAGVAVMALLGLLE